MVDRKDEDGDGKDEKSQIIKRSECTGMEGGLYK